MSLEFKEILYEKKDQVARITINREAAMNALMIGRTGIFTAKDCSLYWQV